MQDTELNKIISNAVKSVGCNYLKATNRHTVINQIRGQIIGQIKIDLIDRLEKQFGVEYMVVKKKEYDDLHDRVRRLNNHMKTIYGKDVNDGSTS